MKYIDADKLKAEINKLRSESCISESDDYYEYAKSEILDIINSLQQEQPSLPSNLDEAALEYAKKVPSVYSSHAESFEVGAEWLAGQGESIESEVVVMQAEDTCRPYLALKNYGYMPAPKFCKEGDEVIVQIRKK